VPFIITFFMAFALHVLFKFMVITEATRRLSEDRQSGALELLLVTPLPPAQIIAGQKAALARLFRRPKWMLVGMNLLLIGLLTWPNGTRWMGPDRVIFITMFAGGIVLLFVDCFVVASASVWAALTTARHARAILKTVRNILLPSWAAILLFWFFGVISNGMSSDAVEITVLIWIVLGLAVDLIVLAVTRRRLNSDFRELVATGQVRAARFRMKPVR
jgi:Na+/melibiose symporter-like transporter